MSRRGFTLVEVVFALAIAATSFVTIAGILRSGTTSQASAGTRDRVSSELAENLRNYAHGQSKSTSGELTSGVRWHIYETPVLVPGASDLTRIEIQNEGSPKVNFHVIVGRAGDG